MILLAILISIQVRVVLPPGGSYQIDPESEIEITNYDENYIPPRILSRVPENLRWRLNWVISRASQVVPESVGGFSVKDFNDDGIPDVALEIGESSVVYFGPDFLNFSPFGSGLSKRRQKLKYNGITRIFFLKNDKILERYELSGIFYPDTTRDKIFNFTLPLAPYPAIISSSLLLVSTLDGFFLLKKRGSWDSIRISNRKYMRLQRMNGVPVFVSTDGNLYKVKDNGLIKVDSVGNRIYFNNRWVEPESLPVKIDSFSSVITGDINGDKVDDILVGRINGFIKVYTSPNFDTLITLKVGEHPALDLFDFDGDGLLDILAGDIDGNLTFFRNTGTVTEPYFLEAGSWEFSPTYSIKKPVDYYDHYIPVERNFRIIKRSLMDTLIKFLSGVKDPYFDEVVYMVAHTPPGVLRAMARMGNLDIFENSAKSVYTLADSLPYVKIKELKSGLTTLVYDDTFQLPPGYYYLFVVHPRILFEIPARIDASFWDRPPEYYGISEDEWLKKEVEIYSKDGVFWRDYFSGIQEIREKMKEAKSEREAVLTLHRWLSWSYEGNFMRFGYKTQDIQPMVIFKKRYGSCGEQSILLAAFARTFLIPIYVVMDRGEDHQWNEFWEKGLWHHWDLNFKAEKAIDHPMTSAEGMGAPRNPKTVSAVIAWHPDDDFHVVTRRYTDVARVKIKILDSKGNPVEGALVVPRSHWNHRNSVSIWGYTDHMGEVSFDLGYEPLGYTIDVISTAGMTGINNFFVNEGKSYEFTIKTPGITSITGGHADSSIFLPINFVTGKPYRIRSRYLREEIRYTGAGKTLVVYRGGRAIVIKKGKKIKILNPSPDHYRIVKYDIDTDPVLSIMSGKIKIRPGEPLSFKVSVFPFHYFKKFFLITGDTTFEVFPEKVKGNIYSIKVPFSRIYPGDVDVQLQGIGYDGSVLTSHVTVEVERRRNLEGLVFQDECTSEHPSGSFVYGPFFVKDSIPFLYFKVTSDAPGADIDMFLFYDKNGNGRIDDMKELVKKSTTPLSTERIFLPYPVRGRYWLYIQGCTIPNPPARFELQTSFELDSSGVVIFP